MLIHSVQMSACITVMLILFFFLLDVDVDLFCWASYGRCDTVGFMVRLSKDTKLYLYIDANITDAC